MLELLAESVNSANPLLHLMELVPGHLLKAEVEVSVGTGRIERTARCTYYRSGDRASVSALFSEALT